MHEALRSALRRHGWRETAEPPLVEGSLPPVLLPPPLPPGPGAPGRRPAWRLLLCQCGAVAFFGLAVERLGMILALAGAFLLTTLAEPRAPRPLAGAVHVGVIATLGWLLFNGWLGFDLPLAPDFDF